MKNRVLPEAVRDADKAAAWYERHVPGLGSCFLDEVARVYASIRAAPDAAPLLEAIPLKEVVRRRRLQRFPYLVIYQCLPSEIVVLTVAHERRHHGFWSDRLQN